MYAWGPFRATETNTDALGDGWARYNFAGYEGRNEYYTEYEAVVRTMERLGHDPAHGCGRAMWENNEDNGKYGTTMALMLLPHWTDGCIGSMEGLFFEASGTTPYHFLTVASMSKQSSNPVRELRYENTNAAVGVREMRALGVRYAMVRTPEAKAQAAAQPELVLVASSGPWDIYEVTDSVVVEPLTVQPVVVRGRPGDARERNLELGTSWFQHPEEWAAMPADDGPAEWQRISVQVDLERREGEPGGSGRKVDIVEPVEPIEPVALPPVEVSDVQIEQQSLSFSVDQVGVPVVVKVSYFPNWEASGRTRPVSHRSEHDGGRPDRQRRRADVRAQRRRLAVHAAHGRGHRVVHLLARARRRPSRRRRPGVRLAGVPARRQRPSRRRASDGRSRPVGPASLRTARHRRGGSVDPTAADATSTAPDRSCRSTSECRPTRPTGRPLDRPVAVPDPPTLVSGRTGASRRSQPIASTGVMSVLDQIVKAYDIRGTVPDQLDANVAHALGVGFAQFVGTDRVLIGRDMRPSGPELVDAFSAGVMEQGIDVIDIGLASTDLVYFAAGSLDSPAAMFTASHNPAQYNGIKLCHAGARPIGIDSGARRDPRRSPTACSPAAGPRPPSSAARGASATCSTSSSTTS